MGARLGKAFLFGGLVSLVGQLFITMAAMVVPDPTLAIIIAMLVFGIVSVFLIVSGVYDKISATFDFAADQPVSGFIYGAAMNTALARAQGATAGKAAIKGFCTVAMIVAIGFGISAILGAVIGL